MDRKPEIHYLPRNGADFLLNAIFSLKDGERFPVGSRERCSSVLALHPLRSDNALNRRSRRNPLST